MQCIWIKVNSRVSSNGGVECWSSGKFYALLVRLFIDACDLGIKVSFYKNGWTELPYDVFRFEVHEILKKKKTTISSFLFTVLVCSSYVAILSLDGKREASTDWNKSMSWDIWAAGLEYPHAVLPGHLCISADCSQLFLLQINPPVQRLQCLSELVRLYSELYIITIY